MLLIVYVSGLESSSIEVVKNAALFYPYLLVWNNRADFFVVVVVFLLSHLCPGHYGNVYTSG
jgi:hypothetical protein